MKVIVSNAFSLNMLPQYLSLDGMGIELHVQPVDLGMARRLVNHPFESIVGHRDTARVFSGELKKRIEFRRETWKAGEDDVLLVGQYFGPRLEEGATELPEGATIHWYIVTFSFGEVFEEIQKLTEEK